MNDSTIAKDIAAMRGTSSDDELRESLRAFGWVPKFPAVQDENGVTLIGNRRLRLAAELGIAPQIEVMTIGSGEAADAERFKLSFVSNIGGAPLTTEERKNYAIYLYQTRNWTQQRIGDALGVSHVSVGKYLAGICNLVTNSSGGPSGPPPRAERRGRPKNPPKAEPAKSEPKAGAKPEPSEPMQAKPPSEQLQRVLEVIDRHTAFGETFTHRQLEEEAGVSNTVIRRALTMRQTEAAVRADPPPVDPATLPLTDRKRLELAISQATKRLQFEFERKFTLDVRKHMEEFILPLYQKKAADADRVIKSRRSIIPRSLFLKILRCLHTDSLKSPNLERYNEAFDAFKNIELLLVGEGELPTPESTFPSYADLMRMRAEVTARNRERAQRGAATKKAKAAKGEELPA